MSYDAQVARIREQNKPILEAFQRWLEAAGLSAKTVEKHVRSVAFFTEYLLYVEPLKHLEAAHAADFFDFGINWFPRKAMWASAESARANLAAFGKFARFMRETERWPAARAEDVVTTLKEKRADMIEIAETYYDRLDTIW